MNQAFLLYTEYEAKFKRLTDEQLGRLLRFIFQYERTGEVPNIEDDLVALCFDFVQPDLEKQYENYQQRVAAGKKSAEKRSTNVNGRQRSSTVVNDGQRTSTTVNEGQRSSTESNEGEQNERTLDSLTNKKKRIRKEKDKNINTLSPLPSSSFPEEPPTVTEAFGPPGHKYNPYAPTLQDVKDFCALKGFIINPEVFYETYNSTHWFKGNTRIDNWQALCRAWDLNERDRRAGRKQNTQTTTGSKFADIFMEEDKRNGVA